MRPKIVREMVTRYGFSIMGPISIDSNNDDLLIGDGLISKKSIIADDTFSKIDNEIINISKMSLSNAIDILQRNRNLLDKLVEILLQLETIDKNIFKKTNFFLLKV